MTSFLQRHGFVVSFVLEDAQKIIVRRLELLLRPKLNATRFIVCLPLTSLDPFGRPMIIIKPTELSLTSPHELQYLLCAGMEALRIRLQTHNSTRDVNDPPVLQYIALLDMEGMSLHSAVR